MLRRHFLIYAAIGQKRLRQRRLREKHTSCTSNMTIIGRRDCRHESHEGDIKSWHWVAGTKAKTRHAQCHTCVCGSFPKRIIAPHMGINCIFVSIFLSSIQPLRCAVLCFCFFASRPVSNSCSHALVSIRSSIGHLAAALCALDYDVVSIHLRHSEVHHNSQQSAQHSHPSSATQQQHSAARQAVKQPPPPPLRCCLGGGPCW